MKKVKKPSEAWNEYCIDRQMSGKCDCVNCFRNQIKGAICKNKWVDKHCEVVK